jgi:signal transduction histidine kinase
MAPLVQPPSSELTLKLEQQVESLKDVLSRTASNATSGELTSTIAHEINNPVFAILNFLELAADEVEKTHPIQQYLAEAVSQAERISNIIRDLQSMNRADASAPEPFDPLLAVQSAMSLIQKRFLKHGIELAQDHANQAPIVFGVRGKLMLIVTDLCINSQRAVEVSENRKVEIRTSVSDLGWFQLTVEDHGIGLSNLDVPDLFQPMTSFWNPPGPGLGLHRAKKSVESMHGTISLTNSVGHSGAVATIELPPYNNFCGSNQ